MDSRTVELQLVQIMAGGAGCAEILASHYLIAVMAVNTDHTGSLVNIGLELMKFNAERPEKIISGCVWRTILFVEIVFETTVIIKADMVAVMTGKAVGVFRFFQELMRNHLPTVIFKVAGAAAACSSGCRKVVAFRVNMTAEASASQQVVGELRNRSRSARSTDVRDTGPAVN